MIKTEEIKKIGDMFDRITGDIYQQKIRANKLYERWEELRGVLLVIERKEIKTPGWFQKLLNQGVWK